MSEQIVRSIKIDSSTVVEEYFTPPVNGWNEHGRRVVRAGKVVWDDKHGTRAATPEEVDWENRVKQVPDAVLYPVERQTATVRFDGMVFGCSDVQRHGRRWIAVGTQSRTYTNRGRNLGAFILDRYSPNYEGTYTPTVGVYEWIGAGEKITPEMRQAIAARVAKL